ncbi:MAG: pilus assembly protein TadG-related protein, partial [Actinomycetes bacterium]
MSERGSAGVWLLCICVVLTGAVSVAVAFGAAVTARHRASSVADLAALAAAAAQARGD